MQGYPFSMSSDPDAVAVPKVQPVVGSRGHGVVDQENIQENIAGHQHQALPISLMRQMALVDARQGSFQRAIATLNRLISIHPDDANHYNNRGVVHWRAGQLGAAIADFNTALRLDPTLHNAYNNRANLYAAQSFWQSAIADYQQALDINPFNVRARINLGITYRDIKDYANGIACFDAALTFGPLRGTLKGPLKGQIYGERGRTYHLWGDWNCAIADYRQALAQLSQTRPHQVDNPQALSHRIKSWLAQLTSHTAL